MKQPQKPYEWTNLEDDFKIPYNNFGKTDKEILKDRYMKLTNASRRIYHKRYTMEQW